MRRFLPLLLALLVGCNQYAEIWDADLPNDDPNDPYPEQLDGGDEVEIDVDEDGGYEIDEDAGEVEEDAGEPDAGEPEDGDAGVDAGVRDAGQPKPPDAGFPIKYIVVLIKENHTLDNYFTGFPGATTSTTAKLSSGTIINRPVAPSPLVATPRDVCHSHKCALTSFNKGAMNGFNLIKGAVPASGTNDRLNFVRYTESQIPNYWAYARNFVLADHFFSTTFGPSFPGHFAITTSQARPLNNGECPGCTKPIRGCLSQPAARMITYNPATCVQKSEFPCWDIPSVTDSLPAGFTWAEYGWDTLLHIKSVSKQPNALSHFKPTSALMADLTSSKQPNLIFAHVLGANGEHPPRPVCPGESATVKWVNAIMKGPRWKETAILMTWDDWGGWYDSVKPPAKKCANGDYMNTGFRVPLIVVSPYAKKGFVLKTPADQASIPRLIEDLWKLPRMSAKNASARDGVAGSLLGAFDFKQAPRPPLLLTPRACN